MSGRLDGVSLVELPSVHDERGVLTAVESGQTIPFDIRRVFYMHHIVAPRGGHAHRDTDQLLIAVAGCFRARCFDGRREAEWLLDDPTRGLVIPRMVFIEMEDWSPGAVGLTLCSTHYDIKKSLRSREDYLAALDSSDPGAEG